MRRDGAALVLAWSVRRLQRADRPATRSRPDPTVAGPDRGRLSDSGPLSDPVGLTVTVHEG